ncbi:ABC transporter permease [Orbaceae bacterium ESL0727]|nr:ABC transporter permease [Orbaceae bacterium ESL0727]
MITFINPTTFHRIFTLIKKELLLLWQDKQTRIILIIPVIIQVVLFPFAATLNVNNATIAVFRQTVDQPTTDIIARLAHVNNFSHVLVLDSQQAVEDAINQQKALVVVQFPADFSRKLLTGQSPQLQIILDGRKSNSSQIAANYVQQVITQYQHDFLREQPNYQSNNQKPNLNNTPNNTQNGDQNSTPNSNQNSLYNPIYNSSPNNNQLVIRHWFNANLDYQYFVLPSLVALITTIGVMIVTSLSVAREREQGTLDQLRVSPLTTLQIFIGKAIPAIIVATLQSTIVLIAGILFYQIPFQGSLIVYYLCIISYGLSLIGFGLFISALCSTQQQAFIAIIVFMVPAVLLSGYISPVENMPRVLQYLTEINPVRHFTEITKQIYLKGADFTIIWHSLWKLYAITLFMGSFAYYLFKKLI